MTSKTPLNHLVPHAIYQSSIMTALIDGIYDGETTYGELAKYGDFGLGTFNGLDGEMVGFDGKFYQLRDNGTASVVQPSQKTPFAAVSFFKEEIVHNVTSPIKKDDVEKLIDRLVNTENLYFAIRMDGMFSSVQTRTVSKQEKPYRALTEVAKNQQTFNFSKIRGTLAGFRSPDFAQGISVAGYHLHFINEEKTGGGHMIDFEMLSGTIKIDHYSAVYLSLPETTDFKNADLENNGDAIKKAEG